MLAAYFIAFIPALLSAQKKNEIADSCYQSVGCFSNQEPWISSSRPALPPRHPSEITTSMRFFNKDLPHGVAFPVYPEVDLKNVPIDNNKTTAVIYYCYAGESDAPWILRLKDAFVNRMDANVIVADVSTAKTSHAQAVSDTRVLAKLVALALDAADVGPPDMHLIGFCNGANAAAYTAKIVYADTGEKPGRLTVIDPIWQLYENQPAMVQLSRDDADFVDVYHADGAGAGTLQPYGHIDFYINGGVTQPGCGPSDRMAIKTCSHSFSHEFVAEAMESDCLLGEPAELTMDPKGTIQGVKPKTGYGCKGDACVPLGLNTPPLARGVYLTMTNPVPPFCMTPKK